MSCRTDVLHCGLSSLFVLAVAIQHSPVRSPFAAGVGGQIDSASIVGDGGTAVADLPTESTVQEAGIGRSWWQQVSSHIEATEYSVSFSAQGLQAPNRAQNLRTYFRDGAIEIVPRDGEFDASWNFTWQMARWGRLGSLRTVEQFATPGVQGARVSYEHAGITEWYENGKAGLEQGFTVSARPPGNGSLCLMGHLGGTLRAELRVDGALELFDPQGALVLRYDKLHVWDATGTDVSSSMNLNDNELVILVEDDRAVYPLTVDPLMSSPAWTAESNQASAGFGYCVASAGDTNGDGNSDVIVGAATYDNGQSNEGRAFVYHGSPSGLALSPAWTAESNQAQANFGASVATAGDVNGDGYSDVIVSAVLYDNGQTDEGRAFVYYGSPIGLATSPEWTAESNQVNAQFGQSVGSAGDVNGDSYSDIVVGAATFDNGETDEGRAFVYHGSANGLALSPAWTAESDQVGANFGVRVANAGDVNGDGYADVVVGAATFDNGETDEGRAFVYHGSAVGLALSAAWTAEGNVAFVQLGRSVAGLGDVDGDGYADLIVGVANSSNGETGEGMALVYLGGLSGLALSPAWTAEGDQVGAGFGARVASAGDANGDGYADAIVGAPLYDNGQINEGRAFVYLGSATGLAPSAAWTAESEQADAQFGISVAAAGDVNGDGSSDVIVGAFAYDNGETNEGRAFVYHGSASGLALSAAWTADSDQTNALCTSLASAGDVNGDGYSDVVVGASQFDNGETDEGRAFVYHGGSSGLALSPAWTAESDQTGASFGIRVATAGDVNGDGYSDVIIGAFAYDHGETNEGRAFVYHGSPSGLALSPAWTSEADQAGAVFGGAVGSAGDVNGDGYSDVIVGAELYDNGETDEGRAYVYLGSASGLALSAVWTAESNQESAYFGRPVTSAGDINGDGYSDIIIGAGSYDNGQTDEGAAFVYHGSASGLGISPEWTTEGDQDFALSGSVASAGDVNGDGYSDVLVAAYLYDNGEIDEGRAFVYAGSASGLAPSAIWTAEGDQAGAQFGISVAAAGDVNGDGYSDVVVGAPSYDNGQTNEGMAFVYLGSASGIALSPSWTAESDQDIASFGQRVSSAGDVNGDGYSDILVSAWKFDNGEIDEGQAFLYYGNGGEGLDRVPRQVRSDDSAPIALLGRSNASGEVGLCAMGRTPDGRGRVRLQYEVKPLDIAFNGMDLVTGPAYDTGVPGVGGSRVQLSELSTGLSSDTPYHWRLRVLTDSPYAPSSPWLSMAGNAITETDFRTSATVVGIPSGTTKTASVLLTHAVPNPFEKETEIHYFLPASGQVRLAVYDVSGREVRLLMEGTEEVGRHMVRWDGCDGQGDHTAHGIYLVRIEFAHRVDVRKLVRLR